MSLEIICDSRRFCDSEKKAVLSEGRMAEESLHVPDSNIDFHIVQLFERLENLRREPGGAKLSNSLQGRSINMHNELRSLEFWRYDIKIVTNN